MGTVQRREREKQQRIDLILDAALEVFAEKGLKNATMDDVAEKAELSKGTLYLYFKSKEHLFFAIDMRALQMLRERFADAARSAPTGSAKVQAIGRAYYQFCFDYPSYFKAMSYIGRLDPESYSAVAQEMSPPGNQGYKDSALQILADAIEAGHADGTISKDVHPWLTAILLWSTSNGVIEMIKNRGEFLQLMGIPVDLLYPAKERMVERGLAPVVSKSGETA